jgi:hypothetical protein
MSGGDGMSFSTLVPIVRHAWAHVVTSCCPRNYMSPLPEDPTPVALTRTGEPPGLATGGPDVCQARS